MIRKDKTAVRPELDKREKATQAPNRPPPEQRPLSAGRGEFGSVLLSVAEWCPSCKKPSSTSSVCSGTTSDEVRRKWPVKMMISPQNPG
ncbi:MAG: hypothetical protein QOJ58_4628 [Alphaproteobacteria bacterium]|nr:hypothetical protein [Alphaproteobacteria bacterium]